MPYIVNPNGVLEGGNKMGLLTMMITCPFVVVLGTDSQLARTALRLDTVNGTIAES